MEKLFPLIRLTSSIQVSSIEVLLTYFMGPQTVGEVSCYPEILRIILNTYWTRPSSTSSLLHPVKVILGLAKLSPILFCTGAMSWMLD